MTLLLVEEFRMRFGTVAAMRHTSRKDKIFRKKCMGM
jgi:hypothetical protein